MGFMLTCAIPMTHTNEGRRTDLTAKQDSVFAGMLQQSLAEDDEEEVVDSGGGGDNGFDARVVSGQIQHHVKAMVTSV